MSFDMTTFGITLVYVLILQPFALLQILPFRRVLPRVQKRHILLFWCLLIALEAGLITAIVSLDVFPLRQTAYWRFGYLVWIPQFVLALCFTRRFWTGHIFIAAFRILFSGIIYTVTRAILLTFCPDRGCFLVSTSNKSCSTARCLFWPSRSSCAFSPTPSATSRWPRRAATGASSP